jgi:hypothetical protein
MDQVLQIALEAPLPKIAEEDVTQPIAPALTSTTPESSTAHQ